MRLLDRAFPLVFGLSLALALPACKPTVTGCEESVEGGADLPDYAFEESPTQWTLAPHSTIDDTRSVCFGSRSLKVKLDQGVGSPDVVTRSPNFTGIQLDKEYEISFHYRYENCASAGLYFQIGNYEKHIQFDGVDGDWGDTSIVVKFQSEPAYIDIYPGREGVATDFQGSQFDNNLMWVDDFVIK